MVYCNVTVSLVNGVKEKIQVENNREIVNKIRIVYFHSDLKQN